MRRLPILLLAVTACFAQAPAANQPRWRLDDLEKMALENNPTIAQASASVRAAEGRAKQAGLYPNPVIGGTGDEIAGGPVIRGGELGGFFEQRIVTAGKLGLSRRVAEREKAGFEEAERGQKQRVLNAVRSLYYQALANHRLIEVRTELARLAREAVRITGELVNVGQADGTDNLAAEIEAQRVELGLVMARNARDRTWRQLAAVVNTPSLERRPLEGKLEAIPQLDADAALERIYAGSPELRAAEVDVTRAELALSRARKEPIPDVIVRGGVRYNRELLELGPAGPRPVGIEGFFDIGVQIPLFNRNQGNIAAARAEAERARLEVSRTKLALRSRLAEAYREYQDARNAAERFGKQMIPRAERAFQMYITNFRQMAAAYPQALIAQRNLFQLQEDYVAALAGAWQRSIEIEGLLLTGGAELGGTPAAMDKAAEE